MSWKEFLKPDWRKIVIFVILSIVIVLVIPALNSCIGCYKTNIGLPVLFYEQISWPPNDRKNNFSALNLIIDIIFWYIISCFIVWIYDRIRRVKKK